MRLSNPIKDFAGAIVTFTRIPLPYRFDFNKSDASKSMAFFPLVGALLGLICWFAWYLLHPFLPTEFLSLVLLTIPILLTGAYHEDGFADTCDSYGGYEKETRLKIMKDSRIGAFAGIGIVLLLLMKFVSLSETAVSLLPVSVISALVLGRLCAMLPIKFYKYVGGGGNTVAVTKFGYPVFLTAFFLSGLVLIPILGIKTAALVFVITQGLILLCGAYFNRRFGGQTGDSYGAMEQIGEVTTYLLFMLISYGVISF